nr:helix-turn-helix transcriptional regulator [Bacillus tequilensis]
MLGQIKKGKSTPTVTTLWKIANGLQVSFSVFLKEDKPKVKKINLRGIEPVTDNDDDSASTLFSPITLKPSLKFTLLI